MKWKWFFIFWSVFIFSFLLIFGLYRLKGEREFTVFNSATSSEPISLIGTTNILLLGITGNDSNGATLTDTIEVIHFSPKKIVLIGIPRDLWVKAEGLGIDTKINAIYDLENRNKKEISFESIKKTVEKITGLKIDYNVLAELDGFRSLVDDLGGINIWVENDIYDPNLKNPDNPSEIFFLKKGWNYLDGKTAAKYIRSRYAPEGDFYRIKHQQEIMMAIKDKIISLMNIGGIPKLLNLYEHLNKYFKSDLDLNTALKIFRQIKNIDESKISSLVISNRPPDNLLISTSAPAFNPEGEPTQAYILLPRLGFEKYDEIRNYLLTQLNQ